MVFTRLSKRVHCSSYIIRNKSHSPIHAVVFTTDARACNTEHANVALDLDLRQEPGVDNLCPK